ncbi:MAG: ATP-binding cassette domain-containing protein [Thermodesulfobacteriota bacterium]|nr:ATP-binding cassette domain-containing protein [Thermodesulfobacteriota bacterium]
MDIECKGVSFRYEMQGDGWALRDIDLRISQGERLAIVGPAGSGKTTLIELMDALISPVEGEVFFDSQAMDMLSKNRELARMRRRIGVLFQFPEHQFFQETAYDELCFALRNLFSPSEAYIEEKARQVLGPLNMDVDMLKNVSPFDLSSGEKRRLALASCLMTAPEIMILDEPTAGMDASGRKELLRIIAALKETTVVVVTHNLEDFLCIVQRVICLSEGRKVIDVGRDDLVSMVERMDEMGIEMPLEIRVQRWLEDSGMKPDRFYADMDDLLMYLDNGF